MTHFGSILAFSLALAPVLRAETLEEAKQRSGVRFGETIGMPAASAEAAAVDAGPGGSRKAIADAVAALRRGDAAVPIPTKAQRASKGWKEWFPPWVPEGEERPATGKELALKFATAVGFNAGMATGIIVAAKVLGGSVAVMIGGAAVGIAAGFVAGALLVEGASKLIGYLRRRRR